MDLERCCALSLDTSTSSSLSESHPPAADRMGRIELEAAEALADLAHFATVENCSGDSSGILGSKGKRGKKRVNGESPPDNSPPVNSVPCRLDLPPDQVVTIKQHRELCRNLIISSAKVEMDADLPKPNLSSVQTHPPFGGGGRSRQNLTKDEKEARRLRRILANRESARQTIRRRQVLCEGLTRKAADLAWENESLKREKELALKEYHSLESKNKGIKAEMAKLIKTEAVGSLGELKSAPAEKSSTAATNCPLLLYNQHPFSPLCWPSIIQSSSHLQSNHGPQSALIIPPNVSLPTTGLDSPQQHSENSINGQRTPLYVVSCPWFFPVPDHGNGLHPQPSIGLKHMLDGVPVHNCSGNSSSKANALVENRVSSLPEEVKSQAASSAEVMVVSDLNETPVGFPLDGGGQSAMHHSKEKVVAPLTLGLVKNETGTQSEAVLYTHGISTKSRQLMGALLGKKQDPYKFQSKKLVDAVAATEARKRRKEVTKLKNLHGRHCRMSC